MVAPAMSGKCTLTSIPVLTDVFVSNEVQGMNRKYSTARKLKPFRQRANYAFAIPQRLLPAH
ncbi:hypothetical protein LZ30DRAFT_732501 [Colletotrichum cereale]|nr:hypothetical protein LZ30DRAFT_732501 [Colletotrichum cereale]